MENKYTTLFLGPVLHFSPSWWRLWDGPSMGMGGGVWVLPESNSTAVVSNRPPLFPLPPLPPCNKWDRDQWRWRRIPTHRSQGRGLQPQAALEQRPPLLPALPLQRVLQAMIVPFVRDLRATSSPMWGPPDGSLFASTPFWGGPGDGRRHPLSLLVGWAVVHQPWNTI